MEEQRDEEIDEEDVGQHFAHLPQNKVGVVSTLCLSLIQENEPSADEVHQEDDGRDDGDTEGAVTLPPIPHKGRFTSHEWVVDEPKEKQEHRRKEY